MRIWIKAPLAVLVDNEVDAANGIVIRDQIIESLVAGGTQPKGVIDEIVDATDHVVIPGLINTHHHYYQTLTRALPTALNKELFAWLKSLYPIWSGINSEMIDVSTRLACAELLLSGCTTSVDHHYIFNAQSADAIDVQAEAVKDIGIRGVLCRGSMSLGEKQGGLPPQSTVQNEEQILQDCERVIEKYHNSRPGSMLSIALAPCSPFSVSQQLMTATAELARRHGVRLHTHLAETADETAFCENQFGCKPLAYLETIGWLASDVWIAHGIHFDQAEIRKLGQARTGISHCPTSNMILASGHCRVLDLQKQGCPVGLGVDGSASNDCSSMMQEVRQAFLLQRLYYGASQFSHTDAIRLATSGSASCIGRTDIGAIKPGNQADLALYKLDELKFSGAGDPLAALVHCNADAANHVMVNGSWKVKNRILDGVDLAELKNRHQQLADKLQNT